MQKFNAKTIITGAGALLLLLAGALTMLFMPSGEHSTPQNPVTASNSYTLSQPQPEPVRPEPAKIWYVYVTGAVKSPGVYKLSEDSRIFQAINAAGGFTSRADDTSLNLAEPLADGVHVHVATKGEKASASSVLVNSARVITTPSQYSINLIDINHASEIDLQKLNGIGPAIARRIIEYRQTHGAFTRPEDLLKVSGIGQAALSKIRSQIVITNGAAGNQVNSSQNLVDINHASEIELQKLNGIGPALSKRIIEYRQTHGAFTKPEDLLKVSGIGQAALSKIHSQIVITNGVAGNQVNSSQNLVDINHASEIELQKLNGIGPALSKRIIEYRQSHGAFTKPEDLLKVSGIGQAKLRNMRSQIQIR